MKRRRSSPPRFSVRGYIAADFETAYAIDQLCYAERVAYTRAELKWYLGLAGAACYVAEARRGRGGGSVAGFVVFTARPARGHIITIDVLESYRRMGVASKLLARAEEHMRRAGAKEAWLETATDNAAAIAFWKRRGYVTRGRLPNYYPNGVDALAMSKSVAAHA